MRLAMNTCSPRNHPPPFSPRRQSQVQYWLESFSPTFFPTFTHKISRCFFPNSPFQSKEATIPDMHLTCLQSPSKPHSLYLGLSMFLIAKWNISWKEGDYTSNSLHPTFRCYAVIKPHHLYPHENAHPLPLWLQTLAYTSKTSCCSFKSNTPRRC